MKNTVGENQGRKVVMQRLAMKPSSRLSVKGSIKVEELIAFQHQMSVKQTSRIIEDLQDHVLPHSDPSNAPPKVIFERHVGNGVAYHVFVHGMP